MTSELERRMKGRSKVEESGPEDLKSGLAALSDAVSLGLNGGLRQFLCQCCGY
jgi:hypothetical protein